MKIRPLAAVIVTAALCFQPLIEATAAQAPSAEATRARLRAFQASRDRIEITLLDGTVFRGRIVETADDSFTIGDEKTNRKITLQYGQVIGAAKWKGPGLSNAARTVIVIGVTGAVLLVLCAAPFPLGFLCHEDPS